MKIIKMNVEIKAVKNYQTFTLGAELEVEEPVNMEVLTQIEERLMDEAVVQVNNLCEKIGSPNSTQEKPKVESRVFVNNSQPQPQYQQYVPVQSQYQSVPCTPKQAEILRKYGLNPDSFDSKTGGTKIKELREAGGKF